MIRRSFTVVALGVLAALSLPLPGAEAAPPPGFYYACGYDDGTTAPANTAGSDCQTLPAAIEAALANHPSGNGSTQVIYMMPGHYCPIALWAAPLGNLDYNGLKFIGVGKAALVNPASVSGQSASLTTFQYNPTYCGSSVPDDMVAATPPGSQLSRDLFFDNLTLDGTNGPTDGLNINNVDTTLHDVVIQHFAGTGISSTIGSDYTNHGVEFTINSSAVIHNGIGAYLYGSNDGVDDSLFANNTGYGLEDYTGGSILSDTMAHNGTGLYHMPGVQVINTIVAANTTDCAGSPIPSGFAGGADLVGPSCGTAGDDDIAYDSAHPIPAIDSNGGPTPSILPSSQATGHGSSLCASGLTHDQREYLTTSIAGACDIGSVQSAGNGTPDVEAFPYPDDGNGGVDFGTVATNDVGYASVSVQNSGGDRPGVSQVSATPPFTIAGEACRYTLLGYCTVYLEVQPTSTGHTDHGTLTVSTTAGNKSISLAVTGAPPHTPPGAPTGVTATAGDRQAQVLWTAPTDNGGEDITGYDLRYSSDNGAHWTEWSGNPVSGTQAKVTGLTNGTAYVFDVAAINGVGPGDYSKSSAAVTPIGHTALNIGGDAVVEYGHAAKLTATLTDAVTHQAIAGASLNLVAENNGHPTHAGVATTSSAGTASVKVTPSVNTTYHWNYAGSAAHLHRASPSLEVTVKRHITAELTKQSVKHGHSARVFGRVLPAVAGGKATLQRKVSGHWVSVGTGAIKSQALPDGHHAIGYVVSITGKHKGTLLLRVVAGATSTNLGDHSSTLRLHVT